MSDSAPRSLSSLLCQRERGQRTRLQRGAWDARVFGKTTPLLQRSILGHWGCVNAVEFSPGSAEFLASGGDDKRVLLWRVESLLRGDAPKPFVLNARHESNIFCFAFDSRSRRLLSSGNDHQVIQHDLTTGAPLDIWPWEDVVYTLSQDPTHDDIFAAASEDGRVRVRDTRSPGQGSGHSRLLFDEDGCLVLRTRGSAQAAHYNPAEPQLLATASGGGGAQLWDLRHPTVPLINYRSPHRNTQALTWTSDGQRLATIARKGQPCIYRAHREGIAASFDQDGYLNSCTMKSLCFAGPREELLVTGSDDFRLHVWRTQPLRGLGPGRLIRDRGWALRGHRSIVNQVRYSQRHQILVSSGVEKLLKVWSPWHLQGQAPAPERPIFTHSEYIELVVGEGADEVRGIGEDGDTGEDMRMMAFFDSLVQRELDNFNDSSDEGGKEMSSEAEKEEMDVPGSSVMAEVVSSESSESDGEGSSRLSSSQSLASLGGFNSAPEPRLHYASDSSTASHHPPQQPPTPSVPRASGFRLDPNSILILDGVKAGRDRNITSLVVRGRQRIELEEARLARRRGRYHSESELSTSTSRGGGVSGSGGAEMSVREARSRVIAAGPSGAEGLRARRLRRMRAMALRLADATATGEAVDSSDEEEVRRLRDPAPSGSSEAAEDSAAVAFPRPRRRQSRPRQRSSDSDPEP